MSWPWLGLNDKYNDMTTEQLLVEIENLKELNKYETMALNEHQVQ